MMLEIDGWKVGIRFSAAHFIPGHTKCSRIHGHDYGVKVRIYGESENPILMDFVEIKKELRRICQEIDHHVIIPKTQKFIHYRADESTVEVDLENKKYVFPREDVVFLDLDMASAEELSSYIARRISKRINFPEEVKGFEICVEEGPGQGACYYLPVG